MGLPASKFGQEIEQEEPTQGSLPSTPILTPKTRLIDLDPRSPSENIVRTPIEVLLAKHKEVKSIKSNDLLSSEESCNLDNISSSHSKLKNIDPRSPTIDFKRTPIIIPDDAALPRKLHNKNFDNVLKTLETSPLARPLKSIQSHRITSPRLLESNLISPKPKENKRKSYVGLLETNLDYVETDLDKVKHGHKINENLEDGYAISNNLEENQIVDNVNNVNDNVNPVLDTEISKECLLENSGRLVACSSSESNLNSLEDPANVPTLKSRELVETEEIPISERVKANEIYNNHCEDDGLLTRDVPRSTNATQGELQCNSIKQESHVKEETLRDFDKKLRNLIYEDNEKIPVIKDKKHGEYKSRVPLGTRNVNTNLKKSISRLKVHDRPQKSNTEFSKIPVFQIKKVKGKLNQQCENTPPRNIDDKVKPKNLQWDPDNTLII